MCTRNNNHVQVLESQVVDVQETDTPHDYIYCEKGDASLGEMARLEQPGQLLSYNRYLAPTIYSANHMCSPKHAVTIQP